MRYLVDNMVQRSVTRLLRRKGRLTVEVRDVLAFNASDAVVAAYAEVEGRVLITHDSLMAERCLRQKIPHIWLRMRESLAVERLDQELASAEAFLRAGAVRVVLTGPRGRRRPA